MTKTLLALSRNRRPVNDVVGGILSDSGGDSLRAAEKLIRDAKAHGLNLRDYLTLAIKVEGEHKEAKLTGYESALATLGLPVKDDFKEGIVLEAAGETFQVYPGSRALFPEVIDDVLRWKYRQQDFESPDNFISGSRVIAGSEMLTTVINDSQDDYLGFGMIAEGAKIPTRSIRTAQATVPIFKFGSAIEFTYEFERRVKIDVMTPYAARIAREAKTGFTSVATSLLINGDSVNGQLSGFNGPAPVITASAIAATIAGGPTTAVVAGGIQWEIFLKWLILRAQAKAPIDTVIGNFDAYYEFKRMFAKPYAYGMPQTQILAQAGVQTAIENPQFDFNVQFALSSGAAPQTLIGIVRAETIEELVENGSDIEESIRSIENQKVRLQKTINKGYRLLYGDTRSILSLV